MSSNLTEEVIHSAGLKTVDAEMAPYAVVVRSIQTGALCTGTLIALDIVLTVARCFYQGKELKRSDVEVLAGVDTLANISLDNGRTQSQPGHLLIVHPNFRPSSQDAFFGYNDVALVSLQEAFNQTSTVRAISVGFLDWGKIDNIKCNVSSYGAVNPITESQDDDLLKTSEVVVSRRCACHDTLRNAFGTRTRRWLCTRPDQSDGTPCVGAGGAGLVCGDQLIGLLVGLVSFRDLHKCQYSRKTTKVSCDVSHTIPVFLDLCPFMPWFHYSFRGLPQGPVNCSRADTLRSSLCTLLVVVFTLVKDKLHTSH